MNQTNIPTEEVVDLSPFKRMVMTIGTLPDAFTESMTYYEALAYFVKEIERIITVVNENAAATRELQTLFVQLKEYVDNYFDNLDVQEEINHKLDEMAAGGELAGIIAQFLEMAPVFGYNTIADMAGADNLAVGSIAKVLGKSNADTGDGSFYRIRTRTESDTPDGENLVAITGNNNIIAQIIPNYLLNQEITQRQNDVTNLRNNEYYNMAVTPLFYYDYDWSVGHISQGSTVIGSTLFNFIPNDTDNYGVVQKFDLSTNSYINTTSNILMYHGGSACTLNNLIYLASWNNAGVTGNNKIVVYNPVNDSTNEINPFSDSGYSTIYSVMKFDENHLICLIGDSSRWSNDCKLALLDVRDNSYNLITMQNPHNIPLSYYSVNQGSEYYDGYIYLMCCEPKIILKIAFDGSTATLVNTFRLPNKDSMGISLGELQDISLVDGYGDGTMLITTTGQISEGYVTYAYLINVRGNLPETFTPNWNLAYSGLRNDNIIVNKTASSNLYENGTSTYPFKSFTRAIQCVENGDLLNKGRMRVTDTSSYVFPALNNMSHQIIVINGSTGNVTITNKMGFIGNNQIVFTGPDASHQFIFTNTGNFEIDTTKIKLQQCITRGALLITQGSDVMIRDCKTNGQITNASGSKLVISGTTPESGTATLSTESGGVTFISGSTTESGYNITNSGNAITIKNGVHNAD